MKYLFEETLIPGLIKSRPNRFIMLVEINGSVEKCHCPSTGKIGNIDFKDIPCLLSRSNSKTRKTKYTVEAIYPEKEILIGINQTRANGFINFFLESNLLQGIIRVEDIKREVKLNNSRIDFLINSNCYIEVKTPLRFLPFGNLKSSGKFNSFERLGRHFQEISEEISKGKRAIVILCYLYEAEIFTPPENANPEIADIVEEATSRGLEYWQINLKIDKEGISLIEYFRLYLQ